MNPLTSVVDMRLEQLYNEVASAIKDADYCLSVFCFVAKKKLCLTEERIGRNFGINRFEVKRRCERVKSNNYKDSMKAYYIAPKGRKEDKNFETSISYINQNTPNLMPDVAQVEISVGSSEIHRSK